MSRNDAAATDDAECFHNHILDAPITFSDFLGCFVSFGGRVRAVTPFTAYHANGSPVYTAHVRDLSRRLQLPPMAVPPKHAAGMLRWVASRNSRSASCAGDVAQMRAAKDAYTAMTVCDAAPLAPNPAVAAPPRWVVSTPFSIPMRRGHMIHCHGNALYVLGGECSTSEAATVQPPVQPAALPPVALSFTSRKWRSKAHHALPALVDAASCRSPQYSRDDESVVYVFGGRRPAEGGASSALYAVWLPSLACAFIPTTGRSPKPSMGGHAMTSDGGDLPPRSADCRGQAALAAALAPSNESLYYCSSEGVFVLKLSTRRWRRIAAMPPPPLSDSAAAHPVPPQPMSCAAVLSFVKALPDAEMDEPPFTPSTGMFPTSTGTMFLASSKASPAGGVRPTFTFDHERVSRPQPAQLAMQELIICRGPGEVLFFCPRHRCFKPASRRLAVSVGPAAASCVVAACPPRETWAFPLLHDAIEDPPFPFGGVMLSTTRADGDDPRAGARDLFPFYCRPQTLRAMVADSAAQIVDSASDIGPRFRRDMMGMPSCDGVCSSLEDLFL